MHAFTSAAAGPQLKLASSERPQSGDQIKASKDR
jgi:hypothetical protein